MGNFSLTKIIPTSFNQKEKALTKFVHAQHGSQKRMYTHKPYVVHLIAVALKLKTKTGDPLLVATALCHDLFEDTDCSEELLFEILLAVGYSAKNSKTIIVLVWELTDRFTKEAFPDWNRKLRKAKEAERLRKISAQAATVKCSDIIDNGQDILRHDKKFAALYFSEVLMFLPDLKKGSRQLYKEAMALYNDYKRS